MPLYLRQSTASQEVPLGFFVDSTDGNSEETGLSIGNTDIKIWKTGATTLANKNSGGATHISNGIYYAVLDATDTDTIGPLVIFCHVAGALAVRLECVVLDEAVYDVLFGTAAPTTGGAITVTSGRVNADVTHIATAAVSTSTAQLGVNVVNAAGTAWNSGAIGASTLASDTIAAAKIATGAITSAKFAAGAIDAAAIADNAIDAGAIAADAITAAKVAADVSAEIADAVWDEDATGHQTGGTFGQAIGDPGADTNTIFKAVVTDATGATVGVDVAAILDDTGTSGVVVASINNNAITAAAIANGAIDAATFAADVDAEILSYLVDDATRIDASALNTLSGHDPGATLGTSTLTQTQVTGGAYALNSASFAFNAALDLTTTQKASVNAEADTALADYDAPTRAELTSDTNSVLDRLKGLVLASGTIGGTGNDATHLHLTGLAYGDDGINDHLLVFFDVSASLYYARWVSDFANAGDLATLATALPVTPQDSTDTYWVTSIRRDVTATASVDLASFFTTDSGESYATAVAGSVVKEIADNAGGSSLTLADIADAVWDEVCSGHTTNGTYGKAFTGATAVYLASGIAGTINTLDALDTAQDSQHSTTQGLVTTVDTVVDAILDDTGTSGVLVSSGTGTGQISLSSGVAQAQLADAVTHGGTSAVFTMLQTNTGQMVVSINHGTKGALEIDQQGAGPAIKVTDTSGTPILVSGLTTTLGALTVSGTTSLADVSISGTANVGTLSVGTVAFGTLTVTLTTTLSGAVALGSSLTVTGAITATNASNNLRLGTFTVDTNAIAWNAAWDAEVQSECADALTAYDAATGTDVSAVETKVDTLLSRITSTLFSGITSLAQWLGLLAGKQTGDSTARTELRATGAGSGTFSETTDSLEALRDRGDAAWTTATGFSTHTAADVWSVATRVLTAGTNIVLAKGTGVTGFNDLSAAQVNTEADTALADVGLTTTVTGRIDAAVSTRASQTSVDDLPTNAELATALAAADDAVLAAIAALNNLSAAQVNAEVVDALSVDTYAEPGQGTPAATASLAAKINYLFKAWRNLKEQTATAYKLYNDAGDTVDQKAAVSSDGTTTTVAEVVSGP